MRVTVRQLRQLIRETVEGAHGGAEVGVPAMSAAQVAKILFDKLERYEYPGSDEYKVDKKYMDILTDAAGSGFVLDFLDLRNEWDNALAADDTVTEIDRATEMKRMLKRLNPDL